jgi:hypothetical protein
MLCVILLGLLQNKDWRSRKLDIIHKSIVSAVQVTYVMGVFFCVVYMYCSVSVQIKSGIVVDKGVMAVRNSSIGPWARHLMYIPAIGYCPVRTPWSAAGTTAQASELMCLS